MNVGTRRGRGRVQMYFAEKVENVHQVPHQRLARSVK